MTDAPAPQSNPPAPAATEVPIDTGRVSPPAPISGQAPDKPVNDADFQRQSGRPPSRREAIQAAYERAEKMAGETPKVAPKPAPKPAPKAAEAKLGHNNPPEPTEKEPLDLKKRPSDQPRGERGQFAPRPQPEGREPPSPPEGSRPTEPQATPQPGKQLPANAPYRDPPQRISEQARAEWANTPESVRGEIHRQQAEFGRAYQQYRYDNETMNTIRHFDHMARQHGTTLANALTSYVTMEQKLRTDLIGGLDEIVRNLRMQNAEGGPLTFRDVAHHVLTNAPEQLARAQQNNAQQAANQHIGALHQRLQGIEVNLQRMQDAQQFDYLRAGIDQFAEKHPRTDELAGPIQQELNAGYSLEEAYRRADLLNPSTQAAQTRTQSAQTRDDSDRSISGAPATASADTDSPRRRSSEKPVSRRDALNNAMKRVNGAL